MNQICDNCEMSVEGLVQVSGPEDLYTFEKGWCFACVYEMGMIDFGKRKESQ
jgi:hypothetical protein